MPNSSDGVCLIAWVGYVSDGPGGANTLNQPRQRSHSPPFFTLPWHSKGQQFSQSNKKTEEKITLQFVISEKIPLLFLIFLTVFMQTIVLKGVCLELFFFLTRYSWVFTSWFVFWHSAGTMEVNATGKSFTVKSSLQFQVNKQDDGVAYTCSVEHVSLSNPYMTTEVLEVHCEYSQSTKMA